MPEPQNDPSNDTSLSTHRLRAALHQSLTGKPSAAVSVVAEPTEPGMEADIGQLLELSRRLSAD
jgi:hypothetical protein